MSILNQPTGLATADLWMSTTDTAMIMDVTPAKVRSICKTQVFDHLGYTRRTNGRYEVHTSALQSRIFWAAIRGSNDATTWPATYTGSRLGRKAELKLARLRARSTSAL